MATTTNRVRQEIRSRLESLRSENGKESDIRKVLNPVEARDKKNIPETGRAAFMWTEPGKALGVQGTVMKWRQPFGIDVPVEWDEELDMEFLLDSIKTEIASVIIAKPDGVKLWEFSDLVVTYPQKGGRASVVSFMVTAEYVINI